MNRKPLPTAVAGALLIGLGGPVVHAAPCGPCAARSRNPCAPRAANPCAAKNPCSARNPCAGAKLDPKLVMRPNGYKPVTGNQAELSRLGEQLWKDIKLSTNGMSCDTCHQGGAAFQPTFAKPYPHAVAMTTEQAGVKQVHLDEMVQFCLVVPMAAKPLPWDSKELAALTAYTAEVQKRFKVAHGKAANPCAARNPCAAKANPCGPVRK